MGTLKYRIKARACLHVLNFLPHPDRTFSTLIAYQFLTFCPTLLAYFMPARLSILADLPLYMLNFPTFTLHFASLVCFILLIPYST
mgnify:CR=1 FL=1